MKYLSFFAILIMASFVISCSEQTELASAETSKYVMASLEEIRGAGKLHNSNLQTAIFTDTGRGQFSYEGATSIQELREYFKETASDELSDELVDHLLHYFWQYFDPNDNPDDFDDTQTLQYYNRLLEITSEISNLTEYSDEVDRLNDDIMANITGWERDFLLFSTSVGLNSAEFWLPVNAGGLGMYEEMSGDLQSGEVQNRADDKVLNNIVISDISGAAGIFMGWGCTLLTIPGANSGVALAIGLGAAWSSGTAALLALTSEDGEDPNPGDDAPLPPQGSGELPYRCTMNH